MRTITANFRSMLSHPSVKWIVSFCLFCLAAFNVSLAQAQGEQYYTVTFYVENPSDGTMEIFSQMQRLVEQGQEHPTIGVMPQDPFSAGKVFKNWIKVNNLDETQGPQVTAETEVTGNMLVKASFDDINIYTVRLDYYYYDCVEGKNFVFDHNIYQKHHLFQNNNLFLLLFL